MLLETGRISTVNRQPPRLTRLPPCSITRTSLELTHHPPPPFFPLSLLQHHTFVHPIFSYQGPKCCQKFFSNVTPGPFSYKIECGSHLRCYPCRQLIRTFLLLLAIAIVTLSGTGARINTDQGEVPPPPCAPCQPYLHCAPGP